MRMKSLLRLSITKEKSHNKELVATTTYTESHVHGEKMHLMRPSLISPTSSATTLLAVGAASSLMSTK